MEKWEQRLSDQVNITLPESIDQRVHHTLSELKRKRRKPSKRAIGSIAAAAALAVTMGMTSLSPAFAEAIRSIPLVGSVFDFVGDRGAKRASQLGLSTPLGQQVLIGDHKITFTESIYDGSNLILGWIAPAADLDPYEFATDIVFKVNGTSVNYTLSAPALRLDNGTYAGTLNINTTDQLPDKFNLDIVSPIDASSLATIPIERRGNDHTAVINKTGTWNAINFDYQTIALYPTTTVLSVHLPDAGLDKYGSLKFKVSDEQGNVRSSTGSTSDQAHGASKESGEFKYYFEPFETTPKQITIIPYLSTSYSTVKVDGEWMGKPITIPQGDVGSVRIVDQTLDNNKLTIICEVTGEQIEEQLNKISLEDRQGNPLPRVSPPIRIEGSPYKYEISFSNVDRADSFQVTSPVFNPTHYFEDLKIVVDLPSDSNVDGLN
ncbi:uncharacterized protein DUF4179 [Paenibacillus cellulosilyticus]|uniref:Uncharacterized protein DUF4179 n=1 Tax=Paenibacillus cellulosilyticus TaxID=375489 RepID=A0A2V2YTM8_9BACL|nr:DUF4179 domain-containing protein [Paenibacillus cellulosilyticus]PWW02848.1 uncharacterized protein DUF4179 [Paenibacillus cellulosilyticus]QKS45764.1 DUF4179 domain-containing protein [Paenibacillus cellulosilyticus]